MSTASAAERELPSRQDRHRALLCVVAGCASGIAARIAVDVPQLFFLTAVAGLWFVIAVALSRSSSWARSTGYALLYVELLALSYYGIDAYIDSYLSTGLLAVWLVMGLVCAPFLGLVAWLCGRDHPYRAVGAGLVAGFLLAELALFRTSSQDATLLRAFDISFAAGAIYWSKDRRRIVSLSTALVGSVILYAGNQAATAVLRAMIEMR